MVDLAEAGRRVQSLLIAGKIEARAPHLLKAGSPAETMAMIPPEYWEDIGVDWSDPDRPPDYLGDDHGYQFFLAEEVYVADTVEIPLTNALAVLDSLGGEASPEVAPQMKNRGGAPFKYDWIVLAAFLANEIVWNDFPASRAALGLK